MPPPFQWLGSLCQRHLKQLVGSELKSAAATRGGEIRSAHDGRRHRPCQGRWNGVAHLPEAMPLRRLEAKPIGEAVKPCRLADSDDASIHWMDRPSGREAAVISTGSCSESWALCRTIKPRKATHPVALARPERRQSGGNDVAVAR
jgi:hypothetical protein